MRTRRAQRTEVRKTEGPTTQSRVQLWRVQRDPFHAFSPRPMRTLTLQTMRPLAAGDLRVARQRAAACGRLAMVAFARNVWPGEAVSDTTGEGPLPELA